MKKKHFLSLMLCCTNLPDCTLYLKDWKRKKIRRRETMKKGFPIYYTIFLCILQTVQEILSNFHIINYIQMDIKQNSYTCTLYLKDWKKKRRETMKKGFPIYYIIYLYILQTVQEIMSNFNKINYIQMDIKQNPYTRIGKIKKNKKTRNSKGRVSLL